MRVIISLEKNPRKPVSILREEIKDFKLLKHIKLPVTDSTVGPGGMGKSISSDGINLFRWCQSVSVSVESGYPF